MVILCCLKALLVFNSCGEMHSECVTQKNIIRFRNYVTASSCVSVPTEYKNFNKKYALSTDSLIDARVYKDSMRSEVIDTSISNFLFRMAILDTSILHDNNSKKMTFKKENMKVFYLGNIETNDDQEIKLFIMKEIGDSEIDKLKIIALSSIKNCVKSVVDLSTYSYYMGMSDRIFTKYLGNKKFILNKNHPSDISYSKNGFKELNKKQKQAYKYGHCAKFFFDSNGIINITN